MKQEHDDSYNHVLKYTGIFGGVQGLNILINLVRNKIVAVLLGPSGMGLASLFNTTVGFLSQSTNLGISFSAVKGISEYYDQGDDERTAHYIKVVRSWTLLTALLGVFFCVLAGPLLNSQMFGWGDHTLHFVLLAPAIGCMAITGGEVAILKGIRRLKPLAMTQLLSVFAALVISVPIYFFFGESGIVPVIVLIAFATMIVTLRYSYAAFPLQLSGTKGILGEGMEMVRLGVAFVLTGILNSGTEMLIRSFLNVTANLQTLGLYNAGYMLTITYAGMVFSSMESDYYPRLSAVNTQCGLCNETVNRQIEVSVLLVSPMLAFLIIGLPFVIPMLFTSNFLPVVGMAQVAVLSMYAKAVSLPIAYLTLAKGNGVGFFLLDACYDVLLVLLVVSGYNRWGLWGTGVALTAAHVLELLMVYVYCRLRFGYRISASVMQYAGVQLPLGLSVYLLTLLDNSWLGYALGFGLCLVSTAASLVVLHQKTSLWSSLVRKIKARFGGK